MDIECPGDTISYECSILSNSESVQLTWTITLPEERPISITYNNMSAVNSVDVLDMNVRTILSSYVSDVSVRSILILTVMRSNKMYRIGIECSSEDLDSAMEDAYVNTSGKRHG